MVPYKQRKEYVKDIGVVFGNRSGLWWDVPVVDSFELLKDALAFIRRYTIGLYRGISNPLPPRLKSAPNSFT